MDTQTELYFIDHLKTALAPDQTLVVSTHRHNMLSIVDRLIVIDAGRIIADGPRDEVLGHLTARRPRRKRSHDRAPIVRRRLPAARRRIAFEARSSLLARGWRRSHCAVGARGPARRRSTGAACRRRKAAALIAATSGDQPIEIRAIGEQAQADQRGASVQQRAGPGGAPVRRSAAATLDQRRALLCLTQAVYYEAGFEPLDGPPRGRPGRAQPDAPPGLSRSRCAASSISASRTPVCQFSFVCDGSLYRAPAPRRLAARPKQVARAALDGYVETSVGLGDPLSRRLCRAALGADAGQGRQARRAYLLSLAGRVGPARRLHRPLHRRAAAIRCRCARRCAGDRVRTGNGPIGRPAMAGPPIAARRERCRRPARHVEGLDAQHPRPATTAAAPRAAIAEQQARPAAARQSAAARGRTRGRRSALSDLE